MTIFLVRVSQLDGTTPTRTSRLYQGPFVLDTTIPKTKTVTQDEPFVFITIKAIAVQEGNLDSKMTESAVFYIKDFVVDTGPGRMWSWGHNTRGQLGLGDGLYAGDPRFPNEVSHRQRNRLLAFISVLPEISAHLLQGDVCR